MKSKILFVVCLLFGLMMVNSGLNKIFQYMPMPEDFPAETLALMESINSIGWLFPLVAVVEIIGGVLIAIPRTRAFAGIMMLPISVGILLTHLVNMPDGLVMGIIIFLINLWVLWENRAKYTSIFE